MKKSIYIADDEQNIRELIYSFLTNEGFAVMSFASGDELLAAFLDKPSDMVILDIMMPGTDGFSLCTQIRQKSYSKMCGNLILMLIPERQMMLLKDYAKSF